MLLMHQNMADPLALDELARAAMTSPYHFNLVSRIVTGIRLGQFLTALRMAEAKHLLLTTSQRATDVCFAVGFESLGNFTTRFGQLVGVAPQELRRLAERHGQRAVTCLDATLLDHPHRLIAGALPEPIEVGCERSIDVWVRLHKNPPGDIRLPNRARRAVARRRRAIRGVAGAAVACAGWSA